MAVIPLEVLSQMAFRWIVEWVYGSVYECTGWVFHTFFLFVLQQVFGLYLTTPYPELCNVDDKLVREWSIGNDLKVTDRKVKVKQSHYRPGQAQKFQEVKAPWFRDNGTGWW